MKLENLGKLRWAWESEFGRAWRYGKARWRGADFGNGIYVGILEMGWSSKWVDADCRDRFWEGRDG